MLQKNALGLIQLYEQEMVNAPNENGTIVQTLPGWCVVGYCEKGDQIATLRIEAQKIIDTIKMLAKCL